MRPHSAGMSSRALLTALGLTLALVACQATSPPSRYGQAFEALQMNCRERGGVLVPVPGAATGQPGTEHACEIRGSPRRP